MAFSKPCPSCGGEVHITKVSCPLCGHVLRVSKPLAIKAQQRRKLNSERASKNRDLETPDKAQKRRRLESDRASKNRDLEAPDKAQTCMVFIHSAHAQN